MSKEQALDEYNNANMKCCDTVRLYKINSAEDIELVEGKVMKTDTCEFLSVCQTDCSGTLEDTETCHCFELYKQLKAKEESYEELRQYHNKCCEDNAKELANWLDKFNQVSRDFHNGNFCNTEKCQQLAQLKEENDRLRKRITTIFACLIRANRANRIGGTLWVDKITTLWDYIAQTLGIEGTKLRLKSK